MEYQVIRISPKGNRTVELFTEDKQRALNYLHNRYHQEWHYYEIGSYSDIYWELREI